MGQAEVQEWWLPPRIAALVRQKHEDCCEWQASLSYGMRPCVRKEGKTFKGPKKQPDGKGMQHAGGERGGGGLHNMLHFIVQYIINMLCGLRESTEKLEAPENHLDLSRAFCVHLIISK